MNRTIASYRRYYSLYSLTGSLCFLSPLVFTGTAYEISLFQVLERQYQRFWKVQVRKIFQGLDPNPHNFRLNDSLVSLVRLRSLPSTKSSEPFSSSYFASCYNLKVEFYVYNTFNSKNLNFCKEKSVKQDPLAIFETRF